MEKDLRGIVITPRPIFFTEVSLTNTHCINMYYRIIEPLSTFFQITYGDYNEALHGAGFLRDKLNKVLPSHMIASRRKLEYERKVLAKYSEICQYGFEDLKVGIIH